MPMQLDPSSWNFALIVIGGYLLGSIPFGLLVTRIGGAGDIRNIGSGNIGVTNVLRTGRRELAAVTLLLDGGKGCFAVWFGTLLAIPQAAEIGGILENSAEF